MSEKEPEVKLANVKNISEGRVSKERQKLSSDERIPKVEIYRLYSDALNHTARWSLPKFPRTFRPVLTADQKRLIVEVGEDKVCSYVSPEVVMSELLRYWSLHASSLPAFWLDARGAENVLAYWRLNSDVISEPAAFAWADEDIYCFSKLPFSYQRGVACPEIFQEFLSRTTNAEALVRFVGSLFYPESDRQQYVWMYGGGNNGKGSFARLLYRALGRGYKALSVPDPSSYRFFTSQLIAGRLGVFGEVNSPKFVTSALFKQCTGNEPMAIENKGKDSYTAMLTIKFLLLSNSLPALSSEKADLRRIIFCEVKEISGEVRPNYEQELWDNAQNILSYCRDQYEVHVAARGHTSLVVDRSAEDELTAGEADRFQSLFEGAFYHYSPADYCLAADFGKALIAMFGSKDTS